MNMNKTEDIKKLKAHLRAAELVRRRLNFVQRNQELEEHIAQLVAIRDDMWTPEEIFEMLEPAKSNWDFYGIPKRSSKPDRKIQNELDRAKRANLEQRKQGYRWKVAEECRVANANGWYVVMDTLTLDWKHYQEWPDAITRGWKNYVARLRHVIGTTAYGPKYRTMTQTDFFRYIGCVEEGKQGRVHLHCVLFLKAIPETWKRDPNHGVRKPTRREIPAAKPLWDRGFSTPVAVRFGSADPWAALGWRWPMDAQGRWVTVGGADALGGYIGKYIGKTIGGQPWRLRATRTFGRSQIRNLVRRMPTRLLRAAASEWPKPLNVRGCALPSALIRQEAALERYSRIWEWANNRPQIPGQRWFWELMTQRQRPTPLLTRLRNFQTSTETLGLELAALWQWREFQQSAVSSERWDDFDAWITRELLDWRTPQVVVFEQLTR